MLSSRETHIQPTSQLLYAATEVIGKCLRRVDSVSTTTRVWRDAAVQLLDPAKVGRSVGRLVGQSMVAAQSSSTRFTVGATKPER